MTADLLDKHGNSVVILPVADKASGLLEMMCAFAALLDLPEDARTTLYDRWPALHDGGLAWAAADTAKKLVQLVNGEEA